jgi:tagatose-1,6-bisphosphate aldolase non-catalytic subunit AgaZ/GatZ
MTRAFHARGERCYHRAHACGQSLTLAGWTRLAWRVSRLRRQARQQTAGMVLRVPAPAPGQEHELITALAGALQTGHRPYPLDAHQDAWRCQGCGEVWTAEAGWIICPNATGPAAGGGS